MKNGEARWYIDAWAVLDGRLFASRRPPESIESENTVFLSVPDLEPVPIGRISTGLRATRSGFQEGFRDEDGNEIAFETLSQIREIARRVYLGGGLGPGPPGAPVVPGVPGRGAPPDTHPGGAYYDEAIEREQLNAEWFHPDPDGKQTVIDQLQELDGEQLEKIDRLVRLFAEASILEWDPVLQRREPGDVRTCLAWCSCLQRIGLIRRNWGATLRFAVEHDAPEVARALNHPPLVRRMAFDDHLWNVSNYSVGDLLVRTPLPLRRSWLPKLSRMSEKRILPLVLEDYYDDNPRLPELAPAVLTTLLTSSSQYWGALPGEERMVQSAIRWLARELPSVGLPEAATRAVNRFIDARIA